MDHVEEILRSCAKDDSSLKKLNELYNTIQARAKQAETRLDLLEKAIQSDYDSILITTLELEKPGPKIVYVNDGFTRMTGYSREEVIGKTPRILQGPKTDRAVLDRLKSRLKEGQSFFGHTVNYRKDGSEFIIQWDIHPLTNNEGEVTHWVSYQHDITERKRSERKLMDTEMEFDQLIEESKKTLMDLDVQGNIISSNKSFRDLIGFDDDELKIRKFWTLLSDQYVEQYRHKFDSLKPGDFDNQMFDFALINKRGAEIEVKAYSRLVTFNDQQVIRISFENRSLQKRIMAILAQRNATYERAFDTSKDFHYKLTPLQGDSYRFEYVSDNFSKVTGISADEASGLSPESLVHEEDLGKLNDHFRVVMQGRPNTEQFRIKDKEGNFVEVIDYAKPDWNAERSRVTAIKGAVSTEISSEHSS